LQWCGEDAACHARTAPLKNMKEITVNALLMDNGEILCCGRTLGWVNYKNEDNGIPAKYVTVVRDLGI